MTLRRAAVMAALVVGGEAVFFLPFVMVRVFRPTLLDVFGISNLELGLAFSVYGTVAVGAYFFGGPLADRFSARVLFTLALSATAAGGLVLAGIPSIEWVAVLYGFWGVTSILLLWAAMIRATREWGGESRLGSAYGLLEGGRGLVAAVVSSVGVLLLGAMLPEAGATAAEQREALRGVIALFTGVTSAAAALAWLALPPGHADPAAAGDGNRFSVRGVRRAAAIPAVWAQAAIIVCAYCGYKALDDFSLYARDVLGMDEVRAAGVATATLWVRPAVAVLAGVVADRFRASDITLACFASMLAGSALLASGGRGATTAMLLFAAAATAAGVIGLRGLYFAIMGEARVPLAVTGASVGLVSTLGFMPDIFMGPLMGGLLDASPGAPGHFDFFRVVSGFALLGLIATLVFRRLVRNAEATP